LTLLKEEEIDPQLKISPRIIDTLSTTQFVDQYALIREFVSNAYDADATRFDIRLHKDGTITMEGYGDGMSPSEFKLFWEFGSIHKAGTRSSKFKRIRAGKYGFGKLSYRSAFAILQIHNHKGAFDVCHEVNEELLSSWKTIEQVIRPIRILRKPMDHDGVKITLMGPRKGIEFTEEKLKMELQSTQIDQPNFEVYLNGKKVPPMKYAGIEIPVDLTVEGVIDKGYRAEDGRISGLICILRKPPKKLKERGVLISVGGQGITRTFFGYDRDAHWSSRVVRVVGKLEVPWLHTSGGKAGFIEDYQYNKFLEAMRRFMRKEVLFKIEQEERAKQDKKTSKVLSDVCKALEKALPRFPQLKSPFSAKIKDQSGQIDEPSIHPETRNVEKTGRKEKETKEKDKVHIMGKRDTDEVKRRLRKRFKLHGFGYLIETKYEPLSPLQSWHTLDRDLTTIFLNEAHRMFELERKRDILLFRYMARLIAQEITLIKGLLNSKMAYELQNKVLNAVVEAYSGSD